VARGLPGSWTSERHLIVDRDCLVVGPTGPFEDMCTAVADYCSKMENEIVKIIHAWRVGECSLVARRTQLLVTSH
jgi:hypothetical protein